MKRFQVKQLGYAAVVVLFVITMGRMGLLNPATLADGWLRICRFAGDMFPPRLDILPTVAAALWETIEIAFTGTILGFLFAIPLAFLGNKILFSSFMIFLVRLLIGAMRTVPSILYGVIFVIAFGLGKTAGTLGVAAYTIGYLTKLYYEAFEAVDSEVIEAVRSTGCSRMHLFRFAIIPESANTIISQLLFMFEYNIRASAIMGFVGAGGIGYYMLGYIGMLQYRHLFTALLATLVAVMAIDYLSLKIRSRILDTEA
jgi:phosphonate transport system permease protein